MRLRGFALVVLALILIVVGIIFIAESKILGEKVMESFQHPFEKEGREKETPDEHFHRIIDEISGWFPATFFSGKARAGKNSFPPTPFLFARPSAKVFQNSASGFSRKNEI